MAYIYKKTVGDKEYYYLRVSKRKGAKTYTKDIAYLGNSLDEAGQRIAELPMKEIRAGYRTITRFLESNAFLEQARKLKLKQTPYLGKDLLEQSEACRLHWQKIVQKRNPLTRKEQLRHFAVEFAFNTTSLEGNAITLREAERLLTERITPKNRTLREVYDVQNVERVFFSLFEKPFELTHESIIATHKQLMEHIDVRTGYRTGDVRVFQSHFEATPAPFVRADMSLLLAWFSKNKALLHPLALAGIFHHKFEKIHPFFDGNGRAGRTFMNAILLNNGCPPVIVRKKNRVEYLDILSKADKAGLEKAPPPLFRALVEFLAEEQIDTYWNTFL